MELSHYLLSKTHTQTQRQINSIINDIAVAGKRIAHQVQRSSLLNLHGEVGGENVHGELVQKLDDLSNKICTEILSQNNNVVGYASEEEEDTITTGKGDGYLVAFDPLDGSSNIDINATIGTIFSVLPSGDNDYLQPGSAQVLAGYVLYGSSTVLVFSTGNGVHEFTLDPESGDFLLTQENIKMPEAGKYISYNEANKPKMRAEEVKAIEAMFSGKLSSRYIGALVADFHRTLNKGGIFLYPETKKGDEYIGKLRMNYEVKPLGFLAQQAGGMALVGDQDVSQVVSSHVHERVGFVFGDKSTVEKYQTYRYDKS